MADPATAFPAGDPRNAEYNEGIAKLQHAEERRKAERGEAKKTGEENKEYNLGQIGKQEPIAYRGVRNTANKQGLLRSGVEAERFGQARTGYAAKRYGVERGFAEAEKARERQAKNEAEEGAEARVNLGTKQQVRAQQYAEEHPTPAALPPPGTEFKNGLTVPVGTKTVTPVKAAAIRRVGGKYVKGPRGERIYQAF